jgi:hypothetical protein
MEVIVTNDELAEYVEDMIAQEGDIEEHWDFKKDFKKKYFEPKFAHLDWNILEKEYEENLFNTWKRGPTGWISDDIELEKLSDDEFVEEFMNSINEFWGGDVMLHTTEDIDWDDKYVFLNEALRRFSRFLKKYPEQITKVRKVVQNA